MENLIDFDILDKILRKLKFFEVFDARIRQKLYRICRYEIVPAKHVIMDKTEMKNKIITIINGTASLYVENKKQNYTQSLSTMFPGDSIGDTNLISKIKVNEQFMESYVESTTDCDFLVFDKKEFANVLFKEMKDTLYEKIMALKNSEFFSSISPYALVVICSNVEIKTF